MAIGFTSSCNGTVSPKKLTSNRSFLNSPTAGVLPIVATNECYFAVRADYEAHDALLCIADGRYVVEDNRRRASPEHYLKSEAEMAALFADLPEALANSVEIAIRCAFRPLRDESPSCRASLTATTA